MKDYLLLCFFAIIITGFAESSNGHNLPNNLYNNLKNIGREGPTRNRISLISENYNLLPNSNLNSRRSSLLSSNLLNVGREGNSNSLNLLNSENSNLLRSGLVNVGRQGSSNHGSPGYTGNSRRQGGYDNLSNDHLNAAIAKYLGNSDVVATSLPKTESRFGYPHFGGYGGGGGGLGGGIGGGIGAGIGINAGIGGHLGGGAHGYGGGYGGYGPGYGYPGYG